MVIGIGVAILLMIIAGIAMIRLSLWCVIDTHRSQDKKIEKILCYMLYGCGLVMGTFGVILGCWFIVAFLQCQ
jgi:uncharacterized membrane protein